LTFPHCFAIGIPKTVRIATTGCGPSTTDPRFAGHDLRHPAAVDGAPETEGQTKRRGFSMRYFRLGVTAAVALSLILCLTTAAFSMFGPLLVGGSQQPSPQPTTTNHKGIQDAIAGGVYGAWCATSSGCPVTSSSNETFNLNAYKSMGVAWVRLYAQQVLMDPGCSGSPNFGAFDGGVGFDQTVTDLENNGQQILMLLGQVLASCEINGNIYNGPSSVSHWASNWVAPMVRHYAPMGVHTWEIWNESNGSYEWNNETPPDSLYTQMMCAAYSTIIGIDPSAIVMPSIVSTPSITIQAPTFMTSMYADGLHGCLNAIAVHPYPDSGPTNFTLVGDSAGEGQSAWYIMYSTSPSILSVMTANGDGNDKFYLTELGCSTTAGSANVDGLAGLYYCGNASETNPSINQQQQMIEDMFGGPSGSAAWFSNLGPEFWWQQYSSGTGNGSSTLCGNDTTFANVANCAGLYNSSGNAQPSATTFASVSGRW
jgi:hypothetical protein